MSKKQEISIFFTSLTSTMLIFVLIATLFFITAKGIRDTEGVFEITQPQENQTAITLLGKTLTIDYSVFSEYDTMRRQYASLMTPRALLTLETVANTTAYWYGELIDSLEEYFFQKEAYNDALEV